MRPSFRRDLPDSLAPAPTALGGWCVQGQAQPTRPFLRVQDQLCTALEAQLDGQFGYNILNHQLTVLDAPTGMANSATNVRDYWTPTNPNTSVPAPGSVSSYNTEFIPISNRQLENGSHVRLSSLTATYRLQQLAKTSAYGPTYRTYLC